MPTILAIDDKQDNLVALSALLKLILPDCTVYTALSGQEGLNRVQGDLPDVILLDIVMPAMDGYEVCRRLRANPHTMHVPVVMITAVRTDAQSRIKGLEAGADAFVAKPIDEGELAAQINVMLRIRRAEHLLLQERNLLEELVQVRTLDLEKTNRDLQTQLSLRKQTEERLKTQQYYLEKAQEMGRIGTWELDIRKNILTWTDEHYRIFGIPTGTDLTYERFLGCIHPDDRAYVQERWSAALNHVPYDIEHRLIVDGRIKWVREKAEVAFNEQGVAVKGIGFTQDITEEKAHQEKVAEYQRRLKALATRLTLAEERQNQLLAEALHDGVGQSLAFTKMKIQMLEEKSRAGQVGEELGQLCQVVSDVIEEVRSLTHGLNSPVLRSLGFERAVAHWLQEQVQGQHEIQTEFADDGSYKGLSEDEEAILFRSTRELVTNALKHAHATLIQVAMHRSKDVVVISVTDNGCGFNADEVMVDNQGKGFGLFSIQERLDHMKGTLILDSAPGQGCRALMKLTVVDTSCCQP
jgi:PAS domain S-box-containing protein